ncbi:MAG: glycosyltransferase 87 family protein [Acidobacteriota bacterium]
MPTRASWRAVLPWFTVSRVIIVAIGMIGVVTFLNHRTLDVGGTLGLDMRATWLKWDVEYYERIALHGYGYQLDDLKGQAAAGFFPLYPLVVGTLLHVLPFLSFFWLGTIVSNLLTITALALAVEHLVEGSEQVRRFLLIMVTSAGSFYLSIPYTESLFLLLVVVVMILTRQKRYVWAAAFAGLAATTRIQGLALLAVPVIACRINNALPLSARFRRVVVMALVFAVPVAIYLWYLADVQGSPEAFIERQAMWDNAWPYPLKSVVGLLIHPRWLSGWLHGAYWFVYVGLLVRYWKRLALGEAIFCAAALLISTQQETFHGIYRYVTPMVPLALAIANDREEWRQSIIVGNLLFAVIMILAFVTWNRLAV